MFGRRHAAGVPVLQCKDRGGILSQKIAAASSHSHPKVSRIHILSRADTPFKMAMRKTNRKVDFYMDYIKEAFGRMNLEQIKVFLLHGAEENAATKPAYKDTLKKESDPIYRRLKSLYSDKDELENAVADLSRAIAAYEYVYMELGMKAGARLIHQLLILED